MTTVRTAHGRRGGDRGGGYAKRGAGRGPDPTRILPRGCSGRFAAGTTTHPGSGHGSRWPPRSSANRSADSGTPEDARATAPGTSRWPDGPPWPPGRAEPRRASSVFLGSAHQIDQLVLEFDEVNLSDGALPADEVETGCDVGGDLPESGSNTSPGPVAPHRRTIASSDGESHPGRADLGVRHGPDPQVPGGAGAALRRDTREVRTATATADQALRRWRPFRRRALMIARPARVDIRWRKPCRRARRRVFG